MEISFLQVCIWLFTGIVIIILLTSKYRFHPFFALLIACFVVGLGVEMSVPTIIEAVKTGFGNIMRSLGLIIVLGTALGVILEHTGSTRVMADFILKKVGFRRSPLAMSITGFIVGLPIFCDSGYIVLSGVNNSLAKRTGIPMVVMATSLATGLYAVHCLLPPHPGAAAAAGIIGVDFGKIILSGLFVAVPGMIVGNLWSWFAGRKLPRNATLETETITTSNNPSVIGSFLPVFVPILLIAFKSIAESGGSKNSLFSYIMEWLGDPVIALSIGVLLAFATRKHWKKADVSLLLQEASEKAGGILVIIGAGGAFGAVLALTNIGHHFSASLPLNTVGLLFPFLLTSILKTAQGSSTVAIITAASIVLPLLPALGLNTDDGRIIAVLAMGAGSMMISHANDAYFWVIAKFSGLEMKQMLSVYTVASVLMGLISLLMVYLLSFILAN